MVETIVVLAPQKTLEKLKKQHEILDQLGKANNAMVFLLPDDVSLLRGEAAERVLSLISYHLKVMTEGE